MQLRPGLGHLLLGVALLAAGVAVTLLWKRVVWYGAMIVGVIEIGRGAYILAKRR